MTGSELMPLEDDYPVLFSSSEELKDVLGEAFGDEGVTPRDLERIGVPGGGGTAWEIPSLEGSTVVKELVGIVLHWTGPRSYWAPRADDEGSAPPDCASEQGKIGMGRFGVGSDSNPTGECCTCPMDSWGSAADEKNPKAKGKACKEQRILFMLRPNEIVPIALQLPPTSIQPLRQYTLQLASKGKRLSAVETKFTLEQHQNGSMKWSTAHPGLSRYLTDEQAAAAKFFADAIKG